MASKRSQCILDQLVKLQRPRELGREFNHLMDTESFIDRYAEIVTGYLNIGLWDLSEIILMRLSMAREMALKNKKS